MSDGRNKRASGRNTPGPGLQESRRLIPGLGFGAFATQLVGAAAKEDGGGEGGKRDHDGSKPEAESERKQSAATEKSDQDSTVDRRARNQDDAKGAGDTKDRNASAEGDKTDAKSGKDASAEAKKQRDDTDKRADENGDKDGSHGDGKRQASQRQDAHTDDKGNGEHHHDNHHADGGHGGLVHDFLQQADNTSADTTPADTTSVTSTNPNVSLDNIPSLSDAEHIVQSNPDVIAAVSTRGGFAFARSGDVAVISGPDGPTIIRSGAVTPPTEGGNNDTGFAS